ncbi:MAG: helix-turn-helix transcriptional regulator [Candidatus Berkiella sp.]
MSDFNIPSESPCLRATSAIQKIAMPFFKETGFSFFSYARDFDTDKSFSLQTNPDLLLAWFENKNRYCSGTVDNNIYEWSDTQNQTLKEETKILGYENGISIFRRHETYTEIFGLSCPINTMKPLQFYANKQNYINKFFLYFKEQAAKIIEKAASEPLVLPEYMISPKSIKANALAEDIFSIKKYYFDDKYDGVRISNREKICLSHYLRGKSTSEIAVIMNVKKVTVDTYMKNIKTKFNCNSRSKLFEIFWDLGIFQTEGLFN